MNNLKKILITGASGFIGKALVKALKAKGEFQVIEHNRDIGDIVVKDFEYKGVGHVFHLAAKTFVPDSWKNPLDFYSVNVMGTAKVLDFCRNEGCSLTLLSSYVYGEPEYLPIPETHPRRPYNPYSHSKIMAEDLAGYFSDAFNVKVITVRPFNVFGPGQPNQFLIPSIIEQVLSGQVDIIRVNDLKPKRDYIFIDDLVDALLLTLGVSESMVLNVGSGRSFSVEEIVNTILSITGSKKKIISEKHKRPNEVMDVKADTTLIKKKLNWESKTPFNEGLRLCIQQYLKEK